MARLFVVPRASTVFHIEVRGKVLLVTIYDGKYDDMPPKLFRSFGRAQAWVMAGNTGFWVEA
jgi:hypothetical protein